MAIRTGGLLSCAFAARVTEKRIPRSAERNMFINGFPKSRDRFANRVLIRGGEEEPFCGTNTQVSSYFARAAPGYCLSSHGASVWFRENWRNSVAVHTRFFHC